VRLPAGPTGLPLLDMALFYSAVISNTVLVLSSTTTLLHKRSEESVMGFYRRLAELVEGAAPCLYPDHDFSMSMEFLRFQHAGLPRACVVFGGNLDGCVPVAQANRYFSAVAGRKLVYVNMRGSNEKVEVLPVESVDGAVTLVETASGDVLAAVGDLVCE